MQGFVSFHPHDIGWLHLCKGVSSVNEKAKSDILIDKPQMNSHCDTVQKGSTETNT